MAGVPKWSDEDRAAIAALWKAGKTGGEIGAVFGKSRCVILGLISRMGLIRTTPQERAQAAAARRAALVAAEAKREAAEQARKAARARPRPLPQIALTSAVVPALPRKMDCVGLLQLLDGDCKFPLWPDARTAPAGKFFCAQPAIEGTSWCAACAARVFSPRETRVRLMARTVARGLAA